MGAVCNNILNSKIRQQPNRAWLIIAALFSFSKGLQVATSK